MIELFTADTPNGWKISIMLEEISFDYKITKVNLNDGIQKTFEYIKKRGVKPFEYHINLEIKNDLTPDTWTKKEI